MEDRDRRHRGDLTPVPRTARLHHRRWVGLGLLLLLATAAWEGGLTGWQQRQRQALAAVVRPGDLRLISSVSCPFCTLAREDLQAAGVPFDECFIERDAACAADFRAHGAPGTPLVLVRGQAQLGFSAERVVTALRAPSGR